jgi:hypothetical protein
MVLHFKVLSLNKLFFAFQSQTAVLDLVTELKWYVFECHGVGRSTRTISGFLPPYRCMKGGALTAGRIEDKK